MALALLRAWSQLVLWTFQDAGGSHRSVLEAKDAVAGKPLWASEARCQPRYGCCSPKKDFPDRTVGRRRFWWKEKLCYWGRRGHVNSFVTSVNKERKKERTGLDMCSAAFSHSILLRKDARYPAFYPSSTYCLLTCWPPCNVAANVHVERWSFWVCARLQLAESAMFTLFFLCFVLFFYSFFFFGPFFFLFPFSYYIMVFLSPFISFCEYFSVAGGNPSSFLDVGGALLPSLVGWGLWSIYISTFVSHPPPLPSPPYWFGGLPFPILGEACPSLFLVGRLSSAVGCPPVLPHLVV